MIANGKAYLEKLLRPVDKNYECVAFRASYLAAAPSPTLLGELARQGIGIDSSIAWMRLAVALVLGTIGGVGMWSFVVALPSVQADFGIARGEASLPFTLTTILPGRSFSGSTESPLARAKSSSSLRFSARPNLFSNSAETAKPPRRDSPPKRPFCRSSL